MTHEHESNPLVLIEAVKMALHNEGDLKLYRTAGVNWDGEGFEMAWTVSGHRHLFQFDRLDLHGRPSKMLGLAVRALKFDRMIDEATDNH